MFHAKCRELLEQMVDAREAFVIVILLDGHEESLGRVGRTKQERAEEMPIEASSVATSLEVGAIRRFRKSLKNE